MDDVETDYEIIDPEAQFESDVPLAVQHALYQNVAASFATTSKAAAKFRPEIGRNLSGQQLRTEIEHRLLGMDARFAELTVQAVPNRNASHFHAELRCGRILLAIAKTKDPHRLPHAAKYRKALRASNGPALFAPPNTDTTRPIFGFLVYGSYSGSAASTPDFVRVLFPHPNGHELVGMVDLHAKFAAAAVKDSLGVQTKESEQRLVRTKKRA